MGSIAESENEIVLESCYKPVAIPNDKSVVEYLLEKASLNAQSGKMNWLVRYKIYRYSIICHIFYLRKRICNKFEIQNMPCSV